MFYGRSIYKIFPAVVAVVFITVYAYCSGLRYDQGKVKLTFPFGKVYDYDDILVTYVFDGDTIKLEDNSRVRLIGLDTPECYDSDKLRRDARRRRRSESSIKRMGRLAKEVTENIVGHKRVRLEFDAEKYDKYDRMLAYVFLLDGTFVNAKIIEQGYARTMSIPPNLKYMDKFRVLEEQAKREKRGLWAMGY